jgi:hypothetical protein
MQEQEQNLSPLDRAKALIDKKKDDRLSKEDLEKQEEQTRLTLLFERIENLKRELSKIQENSSSLKTQAGSHSLQYMNQTSGMKQAVDVLKSSPETASILSKNTSRKGNEIDRKGKKELLEQVFGEAKDERRIVKHDLEEVKKDMSTNDEEKEKILKQIDELINSEDGKKLIELKKLEYVEAHRELKSFSGNKEKDDRFYLYTKIAKINKFAENRSQDINEFRVKLTNALNGLLANIDITLTRAEISPEYKELIKPKFDIRVKGLDGKFKELTQEDMKVDFSKYPFFVPKTSDLKVSVNRHSPNLDFPQLKSDAGVLKEIQKDIDEVNNLMRDTKGEIKTRGDGILSGSKKYKTLYENLEKKRQFLFKIERSINNNLIDFNNKSANDKVGDIHFHDYSNKEVTNLSEILSDYVFQFSNDMYPLDKDQTLPQYDKAMTIEEFFKWAKQNDIPVDWQNAYKEKEVISTKIVKLRGEYELLAGERSASEITLPSY